MKVDLALEGSILDQDSFKVLTFVLEVSHAVKCMETLASRPISVFPTKSGKMFHMGKIFITDLHWQLTS